MKTKNLFLSFVFASVMVVCANAQTQPPNSGFENWVPVGPFENPESWSSFNNFNNFGVPEMSFKTTDAHSGTYALRLISDTVTLPPPFGTNTLDTLAGFVFVGGTDMDNPGIPFTDRAILMQAFVKGTIVTGSEAYLMATLSKWNPITLVRDEVGFAMYYTDISITDYTQISIPFNYSLPDIPDTLDIKIMAGNVGPGGFIMPGNEFFIDDISFTFPVGIAEKMAGKYSENAFPNPSTDKVTLTNLQKTDAIEIYNLLGEKIYKIFNFKQQASKDIDISNFESGIYFLKFYEGEQIYTEKIVIQ